MVVVWENVHTHRTAGMRKYTTDYDWLTIVQLPSYSPDLNPVAGIWSLLRRGPMANTAFTDPDHLTLTAGHPKPIRKDQWILRRSCPRRLSPSRRRACRR
ncbi:transposase [Streptomyces fuscichromogenes]|uniref:transposase n=1 Tax=Streptomyces fuscichromogenes TaxID=1324013 RepID=UPI00381A4358